MKRHYHYNKNLAGFTTVELLVALTVCSIVLTAVASLAYAIGSANRYSEERSDHQMALRCATVRITDLVKRSVMAFDAPGGIALWTDDYNNDGLINGSEKELVYIETGAGGESLRLLYFVLQEDELDISVTVEEIRNGTAKDNLFDVSQMQEYYTDENYIIRYMTLLPECSNVRLNLGVNDRFVSILFDLTENGITNTYQICARLRCSADHLLDPATGETHGLGDDD